MKIYIYNASSKRLESVCNYPEGYDLPENSTSVSPDGVLDPKFDLDTQSWIGGSEDEYKKTYEFNIIQQPTADQTAQAQQMLTLAKLTNQVTLLQSTVATLMLQNAANKEEKQNV